MICSFASPEINSLWAYIRPRIKSEFGEKKAPFPQERWQISAYICEYLPQIDNGLAAFEFIMLL